MKSETREKIGDVVWQVLKYFPVGRLPQFVKDHIGDFMDYARSDFTGDSFYGSEYFTVSYSANGGQIFSAKVLRNDISTEDIANVVHSCVDDEELKNSTPDERFYTLEEIKEQIGVIKEKYRADPKRFPFKSHPD